MDNMGEDFRNVESTSKITLAIQVRQTGCQSSYVLGELLICSQFACFHRNKCQPSWILFALRKTSVLCEYSIALDMSSISTLVWYLSSKQGN